MRHILTSLSVLIVISSTGPAPVPTLPSTTTHYVEYVCDYFDENVGLIEGCHHIEFSDLNGSLVEILD